MQKKQRQNHPKQLSTVVPAAVIFVLVLAMVFYEHLNTHANHEMATADTTATAPYHKKNSQKQLIRYGYKLITHTAAVIGPDVQDASMRYAGNHLSCTNCHLEAGRKPFSAPFTGVIHRYPKYMGRTNDTVDIQGRINGCMQRSMNGHSLPVNSREMKAIVAYFQSLSQNASRKSESEGIGFLSIDLPARAANIEHGHTIFKTTCARCHGSNGAGRLNTPGDSTKGYLYPPLWGPDSFNQGAGMHRVITAARFIKGNMPFGTTYKHPQLTDAEAFDVAAYINDQPRPDLPGKRRDYPNLTKKPMDCPYPPYADSLSRQRHQFGPFTARSIRQRSKKNPEQ